MNSFTQKTFGLKKKYTFKEKGLEIEFTDKDGDFSFFINFDNISPRENVRIHTKRKTNVLKYGLIIALLTLIRGFLTAKTDLQTTLIVISLSLAIGVGTYIYYHLTKMKYYSVGLEDGKITRILYDKPTIEKAEEFIDEIFKRRKKYYRDNYFKIDYENEKQSELDKIKWLKSENIITENEFNVVVDEINEKFIK
ncbi:hypothetical protein [Flavobacterium nackdongense]|uniref:Uncharacterized protein n=1 Tax=Flavobacterium nackdongense TaxID=2547394 RepID=A0A4P6YCE1_9FLAO|nr:hypothetical protein [Flavobacterium nackdongense]QBN17973.1 hypothetical protein E1750_03855 [Flavobacterium nackdongense]